MQKQANSTQPITNNQVANYVSKNDEKNNQSKNLGYFNTMIPATPSISLLRAGAINYKSFKSPLQSNTSSNSPNDKIDPAHKKKLVLDLDETLVFADTSPFENFDEIRIV